MNSFATATLGALALAAGSTSAFRLTVFTGTTCDSASLIGSGTATNNVTCTATGNDGMSGFKVNCASASSSSPWQYVLYDNNQCTGTPTSGSGFSGDNSTDCVAVSTVSYKIDCGVAKACFSASAQVQLEGGAKVPMSQLNPGDRVLSADEEGNLFYDKVFRVTHWDQDDAAEFVRVETDNGNTLELTPNHYVHVGGLGHEFLKLAQDVVEGDQVFVVGEDGDVTVSAVKAVSAVSMQGLFNVHTLSSRVVVNGVVASHFTTESSWGEHNTHSSYWYKVVDAFTSLLGNAENARLDQGESN